MPADHVQTTFDAALLQVWYGSRKQLWAICTCITGVYAGGKMRRAEGK